MPLTAEQTKGLQDVYKKYKAEGLDSAAATAKLKQEMVSAGVYDRAKAANEAAAPVTTAATSATAAPTPAATATATPAPVINSSPNAQVNVSATPRGSVAREAASPAPAQVVTPSPVAPATPVNISATPRGSVARDGLSAPATVAAVSGDKPSATVKTTEDRTKEILTNLQDGAKNAPQLFQDYDTFKGAYGYDNKPAEEKAQLDAFWNSQNKRSADQLIDMGLSGQDLTPYKGTPEFITASRIAKAVSSYSKLTAPQLAERMASMEADILPGSKAYSVLSRANPQLIAEAERIRDVNRRSGIMTYDSNGKAVVDRVTDAEGKVSDSILNEVESSAVPTLASALGTPEITAARNKASATKTELNGLYDSIESIEDDVRAELKGTGATESYIRALIAERTKPLMKQVNSLERRYANEAGDLKALADIATDNFRYTYEAAKEQRQLAVQQKIESLRFAQQKEIAQMGYANQAVQNALQFANQKELAKMGYANQAQMQAAQFAQQEKMENIKSALDNTEYESKTLTDASGNQIITYTKKNNPKDSLSFDASGALVSVGGKSVPPRTEKVADSYPVSGIANSYKDGQVGGECTKWASDVMQKAGMGRALSEGLMSNEDDTVAFKASKTNTSVPSIGSAIAINNGTKYGHWGIVTGIGSDGRVTYVSSNERGDKKITTSSINNGDRNVLGYYNPNFTASAKATGTKNERIEELADAVLAGVGSLKDYDVKTRTALSPVLKRRVDEIKAAGGDTLYAEMAASAVNDGKISDTAKTQLKKMSSVVSQLSELGTLLKSQPRDEMAPLLGWLSKANPWNTDAQAIKATIQSTVPNLARGVYGEVGVLTDQDINNYIKTIPNLSQTKDVQKAVMGLTLRAARNGMADSLRVEAANGSDVSKNAQIMKDLDAKIKSIESELGIGKTGSTRNQQMEDEIWNSIRVEGDLRG